MTIRILLSNDDGYFAPGLQALCRKLAENSETEVYVAAPLHQQSGAGHSMHTFRRIAVKEVRVPGAVKAWAIDGTPVDAVKIGAEKLLNGQKIDCVISGINQGRNVGADVFYSGTVGAAVEAAILGLPALAVSLDVQSDTPDYREAARMTAEILEKLLREMADEPFLMNLNIPDQPPEKIRGLKAARIARTRYHNDLAEQFDEEGGMQFLLGGSCETLSDAPDDDIRLLDGGFVTLTPLTMERTDLRLLERCRACL